MSIEKTTNLERNNLNRTLLRNGYLTLKDEYTETTEHIPEAVVETHPEKYIMSECLMACKELWKKNIYTYLVSDYTDQGKSFIEIVINNLSAENLDVLKEMYQNGEALVFQIHEGTISFGINEVGLAAMLDLLTLAKKFKYQDVPYGEGYVSPEDFLINYCRCSKEIANPEYYPMTAPWNLEGDMSELEAYIQKYQEWSDSIHSVPTIIALDETKITRSIADYAKMHSMIYEDDCVYLSDFHYQKHLNYLKEKRTEEILSGLKH